MSKERVVLERRFIPKGSIFIKQGDEAYSAYLIQSGAVSVYSTIDGAQHELATLGVGEICGEMALVNEEVRTASVKAMEDCNLIVITKTAFEDKLRNSDSTIRAIVEMLIRRVKNLNTTVLYDGKSNGIKED
ncbi:MAG: cyclic nucleotide-binding domain-containing protein [Alphaproteobacteria bacterium]